MDLPAPFQGDKPRPELLPIVNDVGTTFNQAALQELAPLLNGVRTVKQDGKHIDIHRDSGASVLLGGKFLNNNVEVTSLNFGSDISFDYDQKNRTIRNLDGVSLNVTFFGGDSRQFPVRNATIVEDRPGHKFLNAEFENPLPAPAQRIFGMPNVVNVKIGISNGRFETPQLSQVFADVAKTTGPSIAGLLAQDVLNEASSVALFAESNPKWINDVVDPALRGIYRQISQRGINEAKSTQVHVDTNVGTRAGTPPQAHDASLVPKSKSGAPVDVTKPGDYDFSATISGAERHYKIHVPANYDPSKPTPVVLLLHGHGQDGAEIARLTKMSKLADKEGFIAIYPDASSWAGRDEWRAWDTDNGLVPPGKNADEVAFLRHIIDTAEKNYRVDPQRIFMGGLSNGGMMSFRAAGELSDKIAAVAVVSGAMSGGEPALKHPVSVLHMHGTEDEIIPYDGLKNVPPTLNAIGLPRFKPTDYVTRFFTEQNKINGTPTVEQHGNIIERHFVNPANGVEVEEYTVRGGHHIPNDIDGTINHIWQFFKEHPKAAGGVSGTVQPKPEQPLNIAERLKEHIRTRGVHGIELDTGEMLNEIPNLGDGSFSPAGALSTFQSKTGIKLDDGISNFLKATNSISKQGQHITFDLTKPQQIALPRTAGGFGLSSVDVNNPSLDLTQQNGRPWFTNIEGITLNAHGFGRNFSIPLREIGQKIDGSGTPYYRARVDNPLPDWARTVMFAKSQIPLEMRLNQSGGATILNQSELKDAALGVNPITRGYIDFAQHTGSAFSDPSIGNSVALAKDILIAGGTGYGAYRLAALRFGRIGRIGIAATTVGLIAPSIIHGIERLIAD